MIQIGIDPSLNSTGVCIKHDNTFHYYIISSKSTKKMREFSHDRIHYCFYDKLDTNKKENEYAVIEANKANNVHSVCEIIKDIIRASIEWYASDNKNNCEVFIEGISYGSVGSSAIADLSGLNFAIRNILIDLGIKFTVVSPAQNKKFATGNGAADKDLMVYSWLMIEKSFRDIKDIKIDDLADAFFLSNTQK